MPSRTNILIVKYGALGDVVRTSFFAKPLRALSGDHTVRLYWLTAPTSAPLIRFNPYIDVIATNPADLSAVEFDVIYSLDDETEILSAVAKLRTRKTIGASLLADGSKSYCNQSAYWFDMGLLSRFGKVQADLLKRNNQLTHSQIFQGLFGVTETDFTFYGSPAANESGEHTLSLLAKGAVPIGLNAFAGKRWAAKALPDAEFPKLVEALCSLTVDGYPVHLFLIGSGADLIKNREYLENGSAPTNVSALDTDANILDLAAAVRAMRLLITTDSLCLHLAVGQQVPTVSFFAPTSEAEIENLPIMRKVASLSSDYCSYRPDADNSTISANRLIEKTLELLHGRKNA